MKILIIDDESAVQRYLAELLSQHGHDTEAVERPDQASMLLATAPFDLVISDIEMPGRSGLDFANDLRREYPELPVILTTGSGNQQFLHRSRELGTGFLQKPFSASDLLDQIDDLARVPDDGEAGLSSR